MLVPYFHLCHFFFLLLFIMPPVNSKKRKSLTAAQKKEICLKKANNPFIKQKELAVQYDVSEGMVSDILKEKERWLSIDLNSLQASLRREKKVAFPIIEEALTVCGGRSFLAAGQILYFNRYSGNDCAGCVGDRSVESAVHVLREKPAVKSEERRSCDGQNKQNLPQRAVVHESSKEY